MIHIRQYTPYGCGMYAVANALQKPDFACGDRLAESRGGNTIYQLNTWLSQDELYLDPLYFNTCGVPKLPSEIATIVPDDESETLPIVLSVKKTHDSKVHMIAAHLTKNGYIEFFDSLRSKSAFCTLGTLPYVEIYGLWVFCSTIDNSYVCIRCTKQ